MINAGDIHHTIRVYDLRGTEFYKGKFTNDIILSMKAMELQHGMYFIDIYSVRGRVVKKVIYSP